MGCAESVRVISKAQQIKAWFTKAMDFFLLQRFRHFPFVDLE